MGDFYHDYIIPVSVGVTVIAIGAAGVIFRAQVLSFWKNLGTFTFTIPALGSFEAANSASTQTVQIKGIRTVAVVAIIAFFVALTAIVGLISESTENLPIGVTQYVSDVPIQAPNSVPTMAFATCKDVANETPIGGACILQPGNGGERRLQNAGLVIDFAPVSNKIGTGYLCEYNGGPTTKLLAVVYCVSKSRMVFK